MYSNWSPKPPALLKTIQLLDCSQQRSPAGYTAIFNSMDHATYTAYYGDDHSYAGDLTGQATEADDLLDPLLREYLPSSSRLLFDPTGQSQSSRPSMARAQTPISLAEKVGYLGFGYTTGGEPLSDLCEDTAENNYDVGNCTTPNATATASSSKRHSKIKAKKYVCDFQGCELRFTCRKHLKRHQKSRHDENPEIFICPLCQGGNPYQGSRRDNFASHVERHTKNDAPNAKVKYHPQAKDYLHSIKNGQPIETFKGDDLS
ncbi:uncharacterized protein PpBr36_11185 [Pyricularia pennisetigena]|uniref:uncharacterized protein n=1 Tax=Pyricularia pennisetigena TaxID=1578925 RepID=UPI00114DB89A|nr:uncharacterized protein PpBr36_11185 [Pyricularia pennisetigena]TLS20409.1 hypothetical protein PpBr36_11185 [Pyricularia pennisetigena]